MSEMTTPEPKPQITNDVLANWLKPTAQTQIERIPTDSIRVAPGGRRATREMLESVASHGVIAPLLLRRDAVGNLHLVKGHGRLDAARKQNLPQVPAVVRQLDEVTAFLADSWDSLCRMRVTGDEVVLLERALQTVGVPEIEVAALMRRHHKASASPGSWLSTTLTADTIEP